MTRSFSALACCSIILFLLLLLPLCPGSQAQTDDREKWKSYMDDVGKRVKKQWLPMQQDNPGRTVVTWKINRDGTVSDIKIKKFSHNHKADLAAAAAVKAAAPFERLPNQRADSVEIDFDFDSVKRTPLGLTVAQALKKYGAQGKEKISGKFDRAGISYPPAETTWVCLKEEKVILVFARETKGKWKQVTNLPIVDASGGPGPKLAEGDMQVPEGFYKPTRLDASTHLCLWLDYPNSTDLANAKSDKRTKLGGDIQIHEGICSTGCIVINQDDMIQLFAMANDIGCSKVSLIIAPCNLLVKDPQLDFAKQPKWLPKLYTQLKKAMGAFPLDTSSGATSGPSHPARKPG